MFARSLIAWPLGFALAAMPALAVADIYTWIDAAGTKTYSDQPPPKGVPLLSVAREPPVKPLTPAEQAAQRDAAQQAQIQALSERLRWLEREAQLAASRPPPAPVQYAPPPPAPCDPRWSDCGDWWPPPFLSAPVAIIRVPQAHHHHFRGQHQRMDSHRGFRGNWR